MPIQNLMDPQLLMLALVNPQAAAQQLAQQGVSINEQDAQQLAGLGQQQQHPLVDPPAPYPQQPSLPPRDTGFTPGQTSFPADAGGGVLYPSSGIPASAPNNIPAPSAPPIPPPVNSGVAPAPQGPVTPDIGSILAELQRADIQRAQVPGQTPEPQPQAQAPSISPQSQPAPVQVPQPVATPAALPPPAGRADVTTPGIPARPTPINPGSPEQQPNALGDILASLQQPTTAPLPPPPSVARPGNYQAPGSLLDILRLISPQGAIPALGQIGY